MAREREAHASRAVGDAPCRGRREDRMVVGEPRAGVSEACTQRHGGHGAHFQAGAHRVRGLESGAHRIVVHRVRDACRSTFHAHAVVPGPFVVDGDDAEAPEGVGEAHQQARGPGEGPVVGAVVHQHGSRIVERQLAVGGVDVGIDVAVHARQRRHGALELAVESVVGGGVERRADAQALDGAVYRADLEIHARAVHDHRLVEARVLQLVVQLGVRAVGRRIGVVLGVVVVLALVEGLYAERDAHVELVVQVGAGREGVLARRAAA